MHALFLCYFKTICSSCKNRKYKCNDYFKCERSKKMNLKEKIMAKSIKRVIKKMLVD